MQMWKYDILSDCFKRVLHAFRYWVRAEKATKLSVVNDCRNIGSFKSYEYLCMISWMLRDNSYEDIVIKPLEVLRYHIK